jgi:transcriptional regulator with XRE-family HTH domain
MSTEQQQQTPWLELITLRERDGQTQTELAERLGWSQSYVSHLESGRRKPTARVIKTIATALAVPYSVLVPSPRDGDDDKPSTTDTDTRTGVPAA